jgi:hypothetical protein
LRLIETGRDLGRRQPRQHLTRRDRAVEVHQHPGHLARRLRGHGHGLNGPDRARSAHGINQRARLDLLEAVADSGCVTAQEVVTSCNGQRDQHDDGENYAQHEQKMGPPKSRATAATNVVRRCGRRCPELLASAAACRNQ